MEADDRDEGGQKVIFIRDKCRCRNKRDHIITWRVQKFCCLWNNISWHKGLTLIAQLTIVYGVIAFIVFHVLVLRGTPSAIPSYISFTTLTVLIYLQLGVYCIAAALLWTGVYVGNLELIKSFPWVLLFIYVIVPIQIIVIAIQGKSLVEILAMSDYGMGVKQNMEQEKKLELIILCTFITALFICDILLTTYFIVLSLSWIDRLEIELENENV